MDIFDDEYEHIDDGTIFYYVNPVYEFNDNLGHPTNDDNNDDEDLLLYSKLENSASICRQPSPINNRASSVELSESTYCTCIFNYYYNIIKKCFK
jgi:hypothetical protein